MTRAADISVENIDNANDDLFAVNTARVSFHKESALVENCECGEPGNPDCTAVCAFELGVQDQRLLNYLAEHDHWSPFSHCRFTFTADLNILISVPENQNLRASLVFDGNMRKVRHSVLGWIKLLQNGFVNPEYMGAIAKHLIVAMPHSAEAYGLGEYEIDQLVHRVYDQDETDPDYIDLSFRIKAPIFLARQLGKHQVGLAWNEVSRRYVSDEPEFYMPDGWRGKPPGSIKQGSSQEMIPYAGAKVMVLANDGEWDNHVQTTVNHSKLCQIALSVYNDKLDAGIAPEMARMVLPQSMMTEWIWTGSLTTFARVCKLRLDSHAQLENLKVAEPIALAAAIRAPAQWEALLA